MKFSKFLLRLNSFATTSAMVLLFYYENMHSQKHHVRSYYLFKFAFFPKQKARFARGEQPCNNQLGLGLHNQSTESNSGELRI